jgi:A/G-specific adenine glycosylase
MNFGVIIRGWYEKNKRVLPWRLTTDPYAIWISEVILQQTRIDQGLAYYLRFMENFPDIGSLARAGEDRVLKIWQGLGYYSRARNLHHTAKYISKHLGGIFPATYQELLELRGIGPYTAAAIASICFGEPRAVVDGNVSRVIARLYGVDEPVNRPPGTRLVARLAQQLMDEAAVAGPRAVQESPAAYSRSGGASLPGIHNQAMMEFGALQCIPLSPRCGECPLAGGCSAYATGRVGQLPVKIRGRKPVNRWFYFYVITSNGETVLEKRGNTDIWGSLYQFPLVESTSERTEQEALEEISRILGERETTLRSFSPPVRHQLTHRTIFARFIHLEVSSLGQGLPGGWIVVPADRMDQYPVPRLIHRYLESVNF